MFRFSKNNSPNNKDGLSQQQVTTLMRHISTITSICMVQPSHITDFDEGKEEFRRSMRRRENVDFIKIRKQRLLEQQSEEKIENEIIQNNRTTDTVDGTCCSNFNRFSKILETPSSILHYKDLIKSISVQLFSKKTKPSNKLIDTKIDNFSESRKDDDNVSVPEKEDERTMNFVLTQKFIGWKV